MSCSVNPFASDTLFAGSFFSTKAVVTKSVGNVLMEVNNSPFLEYMHTLGIVASDGSIDGINTIPLIVNYNDGTAPVTRAMYKVNEAGHAMCGGKIPEGSTLSIGTLLYEDVVAAAHSLADELLSLERGNVFLMYPCISRLLALGFDSETELRAICAKLSGVTPYTISYAGGEICPVSDESGNIINRLHNFSFVTCLL